MADTLIQGTTIIEDKRSERGEVWSCSGIKFHIQAPATDNVVYNSSGSGGGILASEDNKEFSVSVELPNGVTVTNVVVYGNAGAIAGITWTLYRADQVGADVAMASAAVGTEDTTITNAIITNLTHSYYLTCAVNEFDNTDEIFGARIKYEF